MTPCAQLLTYVCVQDDLHVVPQLCFDHVFSIDIYADAGFRATDPEPMQPSVGKKQQIVTRHRAHYYVDGTHIFRVRDIALSARHDLSFTLTAILQQVQLTLYKLHASLLSRISIAFQDMLDARSSPIWKELKEGRMDDEPIVLPDVTQEEFDFFLRATVYGP